MAIPSTIPVSIASLTTLLAQRLGINLSAKDYWVQNELDYLVRSAIREFQVLTGYWRERLILTTVAGTPFYDLSAIASPAIQNSVLDTDILAQVGYHLLEYAGSGDYINTGQFSIDAVAAALGEQTDRILGETRLMVADEETLPGPPPPQGRVLLNPATIQIHRAEWQDAASGLWSLLDRSDDISGYGWSNNWQQNPTTPQAYALDVTPPLQLQFIPPPLAEGALSLLLTVSQGYAYSAGTPVTLALPDDSTWALTWGVLAAVLRQDAQSRDYRRADYAQQRFHSALGVLKSFPCVLQAWPLGLQQLPSTLFNLDHWQPGWRNLTPGSPQTIALGGRNLVAVVPLPDEVYEIALDCIGNSPASVAPSTTSFAVANDIVTALLDNAQHAACFKLAGPEFEGTMGMYRSFLEVAESYASRERAEAINWKNLRAVTMLENQQTPYELAPAEETA
jgi:hypothetical protein